MYMTVCMHQTQIYQVQGCVCVRRIELIGRCEVGQGGRIGAVHQFDLGESIVGLQALGIEPQCAPKLQRGFGSASVLQVGVPVLEMIERTLLVGGTGGSG